MNAMTRCVLIVLLGSVVSLTNGREFQFMNRLPSEIWVGCQGNQGHMALANGGWRLGAFQRMILYAPDNWGGRFWARTWCDGGTGHCETGDCGNNLECAGRSGVSPISLAEIQLNGYGGLDFYDISLVDGFNVKISIIPLGGEGTGSRYSCENAKCDFNLNQECPAQLKKYGSGGVVACMSACLAFNTDEFCCRGKYGSPRLCKPWNWQRNYARYFKNRCPDAYSYAFDDKLSTFTCKAPAYLITFG